MIRTYLQAMLFADEQSYRLGSSKRKIISLQTALVERRGTSNGKIFQKSPWIFAIIDLATHREHVIAVDSEKELDAWIFHLDSEISANAKHLITTFSSRSGDASSPFAHPKSRRGTARISLNGGNVSPIHQNVDAASIEIENMAKFAERWKREAAFWKHELARHLENENSYRAEADRRIQTLRAELDDLMHVHFRNPQAATSASLPAGADSEGPGVATTSRARAPLPHMDSGSDSTPCASTAFGYGISSSSSSEGGEPCLDESRDSRARRGFATEQPPATRQPPNVSFASDSDSGPPEMSEPRSEPDSADSSASGSQWSRSRSGSAATGQDSPIRVRRNHRSRGRSERASVSPAAEVAWRHALLSSATTHALARAAAAWFVEPPPLVRRRARGTLRAFRAAVVARRLRRLRALERRDPRTRRAGMAGLDMQATSPESGEEVR